LESDGQPSKDAFTITIGLGFNGTQPPQLTPDKPTVTDLITFNKPSVEFLGSETLTILAGSERARFACKSGQNDKHYLNCVVPVQTVRRWSDLDLVEGRVGIVEFRLNSSQMQLIRAYLHVIGVRQ
jgi:hypothetical protein